MSTTEDPNAGVIAEFRANAGQLGGAFTGAPLLLLHSTGAKSGKTRVNPMMYLPDQGRYLVFASKAGADTNPDWYHNLKANPAAEIEVGADTVQVTAVEVTGTERDDLYAKQSALYPGFAGYQEQTTRVIPVIALVPAAGGSGVGG